MSFAPSARLVGAAGAAHAADQIALAALPLVAVVGLGLGPAAVGALVAAQGAAWLVLSLPAGVLVDRFERRTLLVASQGLAAMGFAVAAASASAASGPGLAVGAFVAASGTVLFALAAMALVPDLVGRADLPGTNARLELARAVAALAAPILAALLVGRGSPALAFGAASFCAMAALILTLRLPPDAPRTPAPSRPPILRGIREGAGFALRHELLRGILACAVLWNFAFFALNASFVPFALARIGLDVGVVGLVQSAYGVGLIAGALLASPILARVEPRAVLIAGPALSALAAAVLLSAPHGGGAGAALLAFFLIGFGPMLWLICQTSIRQLVTPPDRRGRVAALIQVAIYGVRPLGALVGGWIGSTLGLDAAVALALAAFALSTVVPLASALGRLSTLPRAVREA